MSYNHLQEEVDNYNGIQSLNSVGAFKNILKLHIMLDHSGILPPPMFWEMFDSLEELCIIFTSRVHQRIAYFYEDTIFSTKLRGIF